jgi:oligoribonuclease
MKYISIDIETTGLNSEKCQVLQIGAVLEDTNNPLSIGLLPQFNCIIEHPEYYGQPTPLRMNSWIFEILSGLDKKSKEESVSYRKEHNIIPVGLVAQTFRIWLINNGFTQKQPNGPILINVAGKNFGNFDLQFLKKLPHWASYVQVRQRIIDPAVMFMNWTLDDTLPNLSTCLERSDQHGLVMHDAIQDAIDVVNVIRFATKNYTKNFFE